MRVFVTICAIVGLASGAAHAQQVADLIILDGPTVVNLRYVDTTVDAFSPPSFDEVQIELDQPLDDRCPAPRELAFGGNSSLNLVVLEELRRSLQEGVPLTSVAYVFLVVNGSRSCVLSAVEP